MYDLVDGESNVGVNGEHLSERVLKLCGVQVAIQQAAHHVEKRWVVLLQLYFTCGGRALFKCLPSFNNVW